MFWNKSDHKKYNGFVLVLYLSCNIVLLNQKKGGNIKLSRILASFISFVNKKDKCLYR